MDGERIKVILGLVGPTPNGKDVIFDTNMSVARYVSLIIAVVEAVFFIVSVSGLGAPIADESMRIAYDFAYACMIVFSVMLFVVSGMYRRGFFRSRVVPRCALYLFMVGSAAFGVFVSAIDLIQGEQILVFLVMMVICLCLFILPPAVSIPFSIIAFGAFDIIAYACGGTFSDAMKVNYTSAFIALMVAAVLRYRAAAIMVKNAEEARAAAMHDVDTGLSNRVALMNDRRGFLGTSLVLFICDLDDFKYFNSAYG